MKLLQNCTKRPEYLKVARLSIDSTWKILDAVQRHREGGEQVSDQPKTSGCVFIKPHGCVFFSNYTTVHVWGNYDSSLFYCLRLSPTVYVSALLSMYLTSCVSVDVSVLAFSFATSACISLYLNVYQFVFLSVALDSFL